MKNFYGQYFKIEDYGGICAMIEVDIQFPKYLKTYTLMFQMIPDRKGVDNHGSRAAGSANATMITSHYREIIKHIEIEIGELIKTPFGDYIVGFYQEGNYINQDHLTLIEVKQ